LSPPSDDRPINISELDHASETRIEVVDEIPEPPHDGCIEETLVEERKRQTEKRIDKKAKCACPRESSPEWRQSSLASARLGVDVE